MSVGDWKNPEKPESSPSRIIMELPHLKMWGPQVWGNRTYGNAGLRDSPFVSGICVESAKPLGITSFGRYAFPKLAGLDMEKPRTPNHCKNPTNCPENLPAGRPWCAELIFKHPELLRGPESLQKRHFKNFPGAPPRTPISSPFHPMPPEMPMPGVEPARLFTPSLPSIDHFPTRLQTSGPCLAMKKIFTWGSTRGFRAEFRPLSRNDARFSRF